MPDPTSIRRIAAGDGALLRQIRLRALAEDPEAFGSVHAAEAARVAEEWSERAGRAARGGSETIVLAFAADTAIGMVGGYTPNGRSSERHVWGMWVAPERRRSGLGSRLLNRVLQWAWSNGAGRVTLWVATDNAAALRLYEAAGFVPTGERQTLPSHQDQIELLMELRRV